MASEHAPLKIPKGDCALNTTTLSKKFDIKIRKAERLIESGVLRGFKIGRTWHVLESDADRLMLDALKAALEERAA